MILYFSGTGNSRYVAEKLGTLTEDEVVNISRYIKSGERALFTRDSVYVFVAPCYVSAPARDMMDFIREASFPIGAKAYFVITCAVSMGAAPALFWDLSAKKGLTYMGAVQVVMPQNYIIYFKTKEKAENIPIIQKAGGRVARIAETIQNNRRIRFRKPFFGEVPVTKLVCKLYYRFFMRTKKFTVSDACISCKKCVKVCPRGNIKMKNGRPVWGRNCTHCVGCINLCPKQAIEYGNRTKKKPKYIGPYNTMK